MDITKVITEELGVGFKQVEAAIQLLDEGCTVPFIARYRKEKTGGLLDVQLRQLETRLASLRNLEEKKASVLKNIEEQGKLTEELKKEIEEAMTMVALEDIYRPYKQKRRTRATIAKEAGLESLALLIQLQKLTKPLAEVAREYINEEAKINTPEDALAGASDILAETISDSADYRTWIREKTMEKGNIVSEAKDEKAESVYENYYKFVSPIKKLNGYQVLALNRGEKEKILTVKIEAPEEDVLKYLARKTIDKDTEGELREFLKSVAADAYARLIAPSIENEIRNQLFEDAEDAAISVFGKNLKQLLMQPPIAGQTVLGWDPAFRTGCKCAVVDPTGKVLDTVVVYPTAPTTPAKIADAKAKIKAMIKKYHVTLISCGNGTASRESEKIIAEIIQEIPEEKVSYVITNEAGASVYSASELGSEEFPNFDVGQRSATSIARRVQDPLAELVKIDPKSIGVGQYQHDMNQKKLSEQLKNVVEDCVNSVGIDLNTASFALLQYISGISKVVAKNIVTYREENGEFKTRRELLKVAKLGPKAFEQCAGFLRIRNGKNPLDNTAVHPESYAAAEELLKELSVADQMKKGDTLSVKAALETVSTKDLKAFAEKQEIGLPTLQDMVEELKKPGRDPRQDMPRPILRQDVMQLSDLSVGMVLKGTVRNVIDFGAFVDIGVHQDGLVHISQMAKNRFVKHPLDVVSVGDIVDVKVTSIDEKKGRIGLSMILENNK